MRAYGNVGLTLRISRALQRVGPHASVRPRVQVPISASGQIPILFSLAGRAVDANELTRELRLSRDGCVNSPSLTRRIQIERTRDDARVIAACSVQADEMLAIEGQYSPIVRTGEIEYRFVREGLPGFACVVDRHDVMPDPTQFRNNRQREILVGEQPRHGLCRLVLADLVVYLVSVRAHIRPGVRQILGAQRWIGAKQIRLARAESSDLL